MNYFAHAIRFLDRPYFAAGTAVPDWLSVVDRRMRVRSKNAAQFLDSTEPHVAEVAAGIMQHLHDDDWFHRTPAFAELNLQFTRDCRERLPADDSFRPSFLGHILVEILLDAVLIEEAPDELARYYEILDGLDAPLLAGIINRMASQPSALLAPFIPRFSAERFLYDYAEDGKLLNRLNRVMQRVKLPVLPDDFCELLPGARLQVRKRKAELLDAGSTAR
jgi:hypothetical protein